MPIEQQIVQASHSALEAGRLFPTRLSSPSHLILIEVSSEDALRKMAQEISELGIAYHLFFEPDDERGYTSLTTEPLFSLKQRQYFIKKKLYRFRARRAYSTADEARLNQHHQNNNLLSARVLPPEPLNSQAPLDSNTQQKNTTILPETALATQSKAVLFASIFAPQPSQHPKLTEI